jgi:hypothetical protein
VIAAAPATPRLQAGWRLAAGPLSGWRDDDPDALPRCSVDARHVIRNGDRYAIAGIKLACLPCAGIARPPEPAPPQPRPRPAGPSVAERQFGGMRPRAPKPATPASPAMATPSPASAPGPVRPLGRMQLRPGFPDPGRKPALPHRERRPCAREGCENTFPVLPQTRKQRYCSPSCGAKMAWETRRRPEPKPEPPPRPRREPFREERCCERCQRRFVVTSAQKGQRFCSNTCAVATTHERRRQASAAQPTRVVPVEHRRCDLCGEPFPPTATRTRHCSWPCAMRAAAAPADHGETCPCLTCAERRRERELPPLIGARP